MFGVHYLSMKQIFKGKRVHVFYRLDNTDAVSWAKKIRAWLLKREARIVDPGKKADIVIALGGDGAILEAARTYCADGTIIIGLNLGTVGFLASVREQKDFMKALAKFDKGDSWLSQRMMLKTEVLRKNRIVYEAEALNEASIRHLLGIVELDVLIDGHPIQFVRGHGILVSTATGSTAYNLSAHGPIVAPDIQCMILTELLDHNIPTPSIVVRPNHAVELRIKSFREHKLLASLGSKESLDVLLSTDGDNIFALKVGDVIRVSAAPHLISFVELEKNYFFKSIQEKFLFR